MKTGTKVHIEMITGKVLEGTIVRGSFREAGFVWFQPEDPSERPIIVPINRVFVDDDKGDG